MCGIVGFFGPGSEDELRSLTSLLSHRGPDGQGHFINIEQGIFLGHRRLAIRDLVGGVQPMHSDDGRFVLIFNGEIYNVEQLREELTSCGHTFRTLSDTEILLRSMMEWGDKALCKLDGQFAFCFLDRTTGLGIIARDRFGEKPLFWTQTEKGIIFCSESSTLAEHSWVEPKLDTESITLYLLLGYLPPPYSILRGVRQVRPGSYLRFTIAEPSDIEEISFAEPWSFPVGQNIDSQTTTSMGPKEFEEAVVSRRISDVAVGILLSGGVDSSLVAAAAARSDWRPPTFTLGFNRVTFDESNQAQELSELLGLENNIHLFTDWDGQRILKIMRSLDEPLGDSSFLPTHEIFRVASSRTKVVLTGDGGDELFFGYEPYRAYNFSRRIEGLISAKMSRLLGQILTLIPRSSSYMNRIDVAERFIDGLKYSSIERLLVWMSPLREHELKKYFVEPISFSALFKSVQDFEQCTDELESLRRFFLMKYLPGSIFAKTDTASMANSIEARTVFFHPTIVSYGLSRRGKDEVTRDTGKVSLRLLARRFGLHAVSKRKKHGFALPVSEVIRASGLTPPQVDLGILNQSAIDQAWAQTLLGKPRNASFLWNVLALVNSRAYRLAISSKAQLDSKQ